MTVIVRETTITRTPRVMQLEGMFDVPRADVSRVEIPLSIPPLDEKPWAIGLIVGPSGSGKTTVAQELFGALLAQTLSWPTDAAVVDAFPADMAMREITQLLSSVGFSSPPAWLRPFQVLSNGEQFRVTMARLLAENTDRTVVDEFTSVVDRTVAQIGSYAIAKTVRERGQQFVAVSCHYDIEEWLQPDWVYQPHAGDFTWRSLQRRPPIDVEIVRSDHSAWRYFEAHHYLTNTLARSARVYVAMIDGNIAAMTAVLPFPHPRYRNTFRFSRTVVLPDYQGIGLGNILTTEVAANYRRLGRRVTATLSHPALIRSRMRSPLWSCRRAPARAIASRTDGQRQTVRSTTRMTAGFEFIGEPSSSLVGVVI